LPYLSLLSPNSAKPKPNKNCSTKSTKGTKENKKTGYSFVSFVDQKSLLLSVSNESFCVTIENQKSQIEN